MVHSPLPLPPLIKVNAEGLSEFRCPSCRRLLFRLSWPNGTPLQLETSCPRCGAAIEHKESAA
jgi:predicted RNA-binding Zn-ribbon protein involved in translation (DUF1610 family)